MPAFRSIKSLYPLALAEGEGVGTAYEYFAKRLVLAKWLSKLPRVQHLLIAGLPEKYGSSLDFLLLSQEMVVPDVIIVDDRPAALDKIRRSLAAAQARNELTRVQPHYVLLADMACLSGLAGTFDLCLGCEVLQRLNNTGRQHYIERLAQMAPALALFAPNADDPSHTNLSGLSGLSLSELRALVSPVGLPIETGYVDMPPFPPGLTRSAAQRSQATSGRLEALAMRMLHQYARLERHFPLRWRRAHGHIVYALLGRAKVDEAKNREETTRIGTKTA
jgi:hypothetical protein